MVRLGWHVVTLTAQAVTVYPNPVTQLAISLVRFYLPPLSQPREPYTRHTTVLSNCVQHEHMCSYIDRVCGTEMPRALTHDP